MGLLVAEARHLCGPTGTGRLGGGSKKKRKKKKGAAKGGSAGTAATNNATVRSDQERAAQLTRKAERDAQWPQWEVAREARERAEEALWRRPHVLAESRRR